MGHFDLTSFDSCRPLRPVMGLALYLVLAMVFYFVRNIIRYFRIKKQLKIQKTIPSTPGGVQRPPLTLRTIQRQMVSGQTFLILLVLVTALGLYEFLRSLEYIFMYMDTTIKEAQFWSIISSGFGESIAVLKILLAFVTFGMFAHLVSKTMVTSLSDQLSSISQQVKE